MKKQSRNALKPYLLAQANLRTFQLYKRGVYSDPDCGTLLDHDLLIGYGYDTEYELDYWFLKIAG